MFQLSLSPCLSLFLSVFAALLLVLFFRWHNHLNPAINKEAWTQEEELILIRAHQMHGNRWAELTKYLPGRYFQALFYDLPPLILKLLCCYFLFTSVQILSHIH